MRRNLVVVLATLVGGLALAGCVDERIVYRERPIFEEPAPAAANFVGYSNAESKLTVCGNCHVSFQRQWRETAHANAWQRLAALGPQAVAQFGKQHSTNELGNPTTVPGGWSAVQHPRYQDVQCESCHGPGLDHIRSPGRQNWPLASVAETVRDPQVCGACHSTSLDPYHTEWARSAHALVPNQGSGTGSRAANAACNGCHTGEDALILWGVRSEFREKSTHILANDPQGVRNLGITCAVCHDPHRADIPGQLRFPVNVPSEDDNLCIKCHHKRGTPDPTTFRGPHSPEGPTLLGYAGSWIGRMQFADTLVATHGSERNPRLCAGCHVVPFQGRDAVTGQSTTFTGHTFEATPCVDANGNPVPGPCAPSSKTYRSCTGSGCHGSEAAARSVEFVAEQRITDLTNELSALLQLAHRQGGRTDNWWQCRPPLNNTGSCPGSPLHWATSQGRQWTVALSAAFNFELARTLGPATSPGPAALRPGQATHNPILLEALLRASIQEVRREYGLSAQTSVSLERMLGVSSVMR